MYGTDRKAYHLTADYNWGYTTEEAVRSSTEAMGWETVNAVKTPLTQTDFSSYIAPVLQSDADVLVLNHYGGNMVNSLTNAVQFGLRDKQVNGKNFEIVVPLYSRLMAKGAGANVKGIFGSTNWHWSLQTKAQKHSLNPSAKSTASRPHRRRIHATCKPCCMQMLVSVPVRSTHAALSRLWKALSSTVWATARHLYRAEDHQCFKDVLVVKGKENPTSEFDLLEIVEVTPVDQVTYAPITHSSLAAHSGHM